MEKLQKWTLISIIAVLVVIAAGSIVRATGSGLGCPDWPRCFGRIIPPTDAAEIDVSYLKDGEEINLAKTWTEYINRLFGVVCGLIMLYTLVLAWRHARSMKKVLFFVTVAALLIPVQAVQGGMVVKYELDPRLVTVHFILALTILGLLVHAWMLMRAEKVHPEGFSSANAQPARLLLFARLALFGAAGQIVVGALVRGSIEIIAKTSDHLGREDWLGEVGFIDYLHREAALVITAIVLFLVYRLRKTGCRSIELRRAAHFSALFVILQCLAGIILAYLGLPPWSQVVHISLATWMITALFFQERLLAAEAAPRT